MTCSILPNFKQSVRPVETLPSDIIPQISMTLKQFHAYPPRHNLLLVKAGNELWEGKHSKSGFSSKSWVALCTVTTQTALSYGQGIWMRSTEGFAARAFSTTCLDKSSGRTGDVPSLSPYCSSLYDSRKSRWKHDFPPYNKGPCI